MATADLTVRHIIHGIFLGYVDKLIFVFVTLNPHVSASLVFIVCYAAPSNCLFPVLKI